MLGVVVAKLVLLEVQVPDYEMVIVLSLVEQIGFNVVSDQVDGNLDDLLYEVTLQSYAKLVLIML